jgi:hypothetical protein
MGTRNNDIYFAQLQGQEYLDALRDKVNVYRNYCDSTGLAGRWALSVGTAYGVSPDGKNSWRVTPGGEFGELVQMKVNDYASLVKHQLVLAVQQRPAGIAKAINTDIKTLRDARIGTQLVEYYFSDPSHQFENDYVSALWLALVSSEAYVVQDWDTELGEPVAADEQGKEIKTGDLTQEVYSTWNTARDLGCPDASIPWAIFSKRLNRFDLAAKFPAYRDEILTRGTFGTMKSGTGASGIRRPLLFQADISETDYIEVHKFIHLPTSAQEEGRYTLFIDGVALLDVPYPYPARNFHRISDQDMVETAFAHTSNYDLLGLEQVTDTLNSVAINALSTFGVSTIIGPKGGGVSFQELGKGQRYLEVDAQFVDKIKALDLAKLPDSLLAVLQMFGSKKGEISGINSILRGDPEGALKGSSGSAMALLQSQAISFNSGVQKSFYRLLSSCGTGIIEILRKYADEERVVRIAGKANAQAVKEFKFTGTTLNSVSTVVFEAVNPVLQTASGRLSIADNLLQAGQITNPKRYIEVLTTGNLNVLLEDQVAMEEAIIEENEFLAENKPVIAVITENHQAHIQGHQAVISQPNAKNDPNIVNNVLRHIQEHIDLWVQASATNPALLAATGQQVLPPMPTPGMPMQGAPQGAGGPPPGAPQADPASGQPAQPQLPAPPNDPATGEAAPVAPGTSVR